MTEKLIDSPIADLCIKILVRRPIFFSQETACKIKAIPSKNAWKLILSTSVMARIAECWLTAVWSECLDCIDGVLATLGTGKSFDTSVTLIVDFSFESQIKVAAQGEAIFSWSLDVINFESTPFWTKFFKFFNIFQMLISFFVQILDDYVRERERVLEFQSRNR